MHQPDEFYVGYDNEMPPGVARRIRKAVAVLLCAALGVAIVVGTGLRALPESRFEFGHPRTFEGQLLERPYPRLVNARVVDSGGLVELPEQLVLVGSGKHGAAGLVRGLDGRFVRMRGTLVSRGSHAALELAPDDAARVEESAAARRDARVEPPSVVAMGRHKLRGEVVDSKCFLGVMNPGERAVHRDCAVRCLLGGIPPALVVRDRDGREAVLFLTAESGQPLDTQGVARFAGLPVEVSGELVAEGETLWFRVNESGFHRLDD